MSPIDPPAPAPEPGRSPHPALELWTVLTRAHVIVQERVARAASGFDLTLAEYGALEALGRYGPMLLGELQQQILVSSGGITYLVDRLAARGLVTRRTKPDDRRARFAVLTEQGQRLLTQIAPLHERAVAEAVDGLTRREQYQAADLLRKLGLRLREASPDVVPIAAAVHASPGLEGACPGCVVVVDNDPHTVEVVRSALETADRAVLGVTTAAEAEAVLARREVALILLGLVLPDADGRNVCAALSRQTATAGVPIVMVSPPVPARARAECLGLGISGWLEKPLTVATVREVAAAASHESVPRDAAHTDPAVGVASRAGFTEAYERHVRAQPGDAPPAALALLDWDGLTAVVESHGPGARDAVLRQARDRLADALRDGDILARWREDEFVALFPHTLPSTAAHLLTRAQAALAAAPPVTPDGREVALAFSAGIAPAAAVTVLDEAVAAAYGALRRAGEVGHARIVTAGEDGAPTAIRVLIAEDDRLTATLGRHRLQRAGFEVVHCANGADAVAAAESGDFGLLLVDSRMTGVDGVEVVRRLRATARHRDTPILMLASLGREEDVVRAFSVGADDYVTKPFSPAELLARVQRLLRRCDATRRAPEPNDIDLEARRQ